LKLYINVFSFSALLAPWSKSAAIPFEKTKIKNKNWRFKIPWLE